MSDGNQEQRNREKDRTKERQDQGPRGGKKRKKNQIVFGVTV